MLPLLRFTLDLFEQIQPLAPVGIAQGTTDLKVFGEPAVPLSEADHRLQPAAQAVIFRHPRATRECRLGPARVAYELTRSARRSIGFSVGPDGLSVRAPRWVTLQAVDAAVQSKSTWILRKLQEGVERRARLPQPIVWGDGVVLPYLGQTLTLRLDPEHRLGSEGALAAAILPINLAQHATPAQIRDAAQAWLMRQARANFEARLNHFAPVLGVRWKKLTLSQASTRWGSARVDGSIRLNWRLMHFSQAIIDYVVVHELSHLRVMDHSPQFWQTVASVLPDFAQRRQQLKNQPVTHWS